MFSVRVLCGCRVWLLVCVLWFCVVLCVCVCWCVFSAVCSVCRVVVHCVAYRRGVVRRVRVCACVCRVACVIWYVLDVAPRHTTPRRATHHNAKQRHEIQHHTQCNTHVRRALMFFVTVLKRCVCDPVVQAGQRSPTSTMHAR